MYQIPQETNLEILKGAHVQAVSYSINTIDIFFDGKGSISIEGAFSYTTADAVYTCDKLFPSKEYGLLNLLEKNVLNVQISDSRKDLTVVFSDESKLVLKGSKQYESYKIKFGDIDILV